MGLQIFVLLMAFLVMGFGDLRGSTLGIARDVFHISAAQGALVPVAGAISFATLALPAGLLATRKGKRWVLQAGLLLTTAAHLIPCALMSSYWHLLLTIFSVGAGMTFLLVAGNPLLRDVTAPERYSRNLTFAQFCKSLGSIAGPYGLAALVRLGFGWTAVFPVLAAVSFVTWIAVTLVPIPETPPERPAHLRDIGRLLVDWRIFKRVFGIFLFAGSEMGMNNFLASHLWLTFGMDIKGDAISYGQGLFWISQGIGRLAGTAALTYIGTVTFLRLCVAVGLAGLVGLILGTQTVVIASVVLCGMAFSNVWPCLFALTLELRPKQSSEIAGLVVMANVGGAVVPLAMGKLTDLTAVRWSFLVPVLAFCYLSWLAFRPEKA